MSQVKQPGTVPVVEYVPQPQGVRVEVVTSVVVVVVVVGVVVVVEGVSVVVDSRIISLAASSTLLLSLFVLFTIGVPTARKTARAIAPTRTHIPQKPFGDQRCCIKVLGGSSIEGFCKEGS